MPYIPPNRCYVYINKKKTCGMCHGPLILQRYSVSTKKGKLIDNHGRYCTNCNAFVIKYGTYLDNKKNWIVLNSIELQKAISEYADRYPEKHPYTKISGVVDNSSRSVFYYVPGLRETREKERVSRNEDAKERKTREGREKEKRDEIKRRIELKEEQRIKQLQEFEKKREKEYQRRLAESRARHAAKMGKSKQAKRKKKENRTNNIVNDTSASITKKEHLEEVTPPSAKTVDPVDTYHSRMEKVQKKLISLGLLRTPSPRVNNASRIKQKDKNGDYIITAHDFVVRRAVFKCMHNNHHIEDVKAVFTTISRLGTVNKITIPAGYCSTCNMYFILESTYNRIKKSGIPICRTMDEKNYFKNNTSGMHYNGLASESVLMQFGYTVSKQDDLPAEQRRRILAAIVDNDVLKRNEVVSYLDYFINQRKNQKNKDGSLRYKDAIDKWRADRAWINQYKLGSYKEVVIGSIVTGKE